ncbi:MAG: type II secretion system protein [Methylibium sp.]|nr:type II secretion system protein [Methylibium sp.]
MSSQAQQEQTGQPMRLGELLLAKGIVKHADVEQALNFQRERSGKLGTVLVRIGALSEQALYEALAQQLACSLLTEADLDQEALRAALVEPHLPGRWLLSRRVLCWLGLDGAWHFASDDVQDPDVGEALAALPVIGRPIWHFILPAELDRATAALRDGSTGTEQSAQSLRALAEDAPVIALVNNLLAQAIEARASDVHIEPGEREFQVRLRIDGVLHHRMTMPMERYPAVASRLKLIAHLDIAERRLPQDGHIGMRVAGVEIDVRVSSIPAVHGESVVLRLLPKQRADLRLESIGMADDHLAQFKSWLGWPNGLLLVTGPTGSGKSTTLYSALNHINDGSRKIVTVEDPVEQRLARVVQIQTHAEIGYTFARALRAILRHDPDIIMIGEIRDRETAEIAIQSALTGHLVLATLHTNDALSAISRLADMGVEPYLVAAALRGVMAQRLVRRLCSACAEPDKDPNRLQMDWERRQAVDQPAATWSHAAGCPQCQGTGFKGRVGIYEMVTIDTGLQQLLVEGAGADVVRRAADAAGRRSLLGDGLDKAARAVTTISEVLRASGEDGF